MRSIFLFLLPSIPLLAQYQGVLTSVDHAPGNIIATSSVMEDQEPLGRGQRTIAGGRTEAFTETLPLNPSDKSPFSRSYYLWGEATSSTLFRGNLRTILLSAATVNGYEDIATITITGPKSGVHATRWDLPFQIQLAYQLSSGSTPLVESPTTATPYARSGSRSGFTSTEATPQMALAYKISADGAPQENWHDSFTLTQGTESTATLIPSALESVVHEAYFNSSTFSNFHLALMQSSLREVAAYSTYRIFPIPIPNHSFSTSLGPPLRNERIGNTTYLAYSLQTDTAALPTDTLSSPNGFPMTRWEIIHVNPDGSTETILSTAAGTNPSSPIALDPTPLELRELVKTPGTHFFRVYNRFDNPSVEESRELLSELSLTVQFVVKVNAHIHTYE